MDAQEFLPSLKAALRHGVDLLHVLGGEGKSAGWVRPAVNHEIAPGESVVAVISIGEPQINPEVVAGLGPHAAGGRNIESLGGLPVALT